MPELDRQAAKLTANIFTIHGPGLLGIIRKNILVLGVLLLEYGMIVVSFRKIAMRLVKRMMPRTAANDNCQLTSKSSVGFMSNRIMAAMDNEFRGFDCRRKKNDAQKTVHIMPARMAGAFGGTTSRKITAATIETAARAGFIRPAVLQSHHIIPIRIAKFIPDRLIKCNRPVWRNAS